MTTLAADREAVALVFRNAYHDPEVGVFTGHSIYDSCWVCDTGVTALFESGAIVKTPEVQARALEDAANVEADWTLSAWRSEEAETVVKLRKGLKRRAAKILGKG